MVRTYIKKTQAGEWPQEKVVEAANKVLCKEFYVGLLKSTNYHTQL